MIRSPYRLVLTLLEADELPGADALPPEDNFDPQQYAMDNVEPTYSGNPIYGFYQSLVDKLATIRTKKRMQELMGRNTVLHMTRDRDNSIAIRFHATDIITVKPDDTTTVNTNGYHTVTTAERLDAHLPGGWKVYRRFNKIGGGGLYRAHGVENEQLYWTNRSHPFSRPGVMIEIPLTDGDIIMPDGTLRPQAEPIRKNKRAPFYQGKWFDGSKKAYVPTAYDY